ncbi:hypothetical protein M0813_11606 [Anaeramoeba flamelloides]|uniref:Uncharacterized protein n=1 Tax=Anaeramoeba flamelloides TaxID=1746091 RepID=A0ABQ8ZEC3_9EUKA|nr:hypothetical protein M0813_11606 [Anaeramoeba flamelloides]
MSTLEYPVYSFAWSTLLWIVALIFFCPTPYVLWCELVDRKKLKRERRIQFRRNNIEMVPTKSFSGSHNKKKKKDLTMERKREKKQEKLEQDFLTIEAEKKKDLSLDKNQQNL